MLIDIHRKDLLVKSDSTFELYWTVFNLLFESSECLRTPNIFHELMEHVCAKSLKKLCGVGAW